MPEPMAEPVLIADRWWSRSDDGAWIRWDEERDTWVKGRRGGRRKPPGWLIALVVPLLLIGGFMAADKLWLNWYLPVPSSPSLPAAAQAEAQATPMATDRVVGVLRRCSVGGRYETTGADCFALPGDHLEVTVRTPNGQTYVVNLPSGTSVAVGDPWP